MKFKAPLPAGGDKKSPTDGLGQGSFCYKIK